MIARACRLVWHVLSRSVVGAAAIVLGLGLLLALTLGLYLLQESLPAPAWLDVVRDVANTALALVAAFLVGDAVIDWRRK